MNRLKHLAALGILSILILWPRQANAQVGALRIGMQSPTAASLGKFGDHPVSLYTGTPTLSLPLYEVRGRTLAVPIRLSYHASGVKVEEIPGWVGAGWALSAGGVITRTVRGVPDDWDAGYAKTGDRLWDSTIWTNPQDHASYKGTLDSEAADAQPDVFFFNVAGRSGTFIFGPEGIVIVDDTSRTVPHSKLRIDAVRETINTAATTEQVGRWILTTEEGTRYIFADKEETTDYPSTVTIPHAPDRTYVSSWYLSRIESAVGEDAITFTYAVADTTRHVGRTFREVIDHGSAGCGPNTPGKVDTIYDVASLRLVSISSALDHVMFEASLREDAVNPETGMPQEYKLDALSVQRNGQSQRRFVFAYGYFTEAQEGYNENPPHYEPKRLRLDEVQEEGADGTPLAPYRFTYHTGISLPSRFSYAMDHWGYYNGAQTNDTLIPLYYEADGQAYYAGGLRQADGDHTLAGILTKITYPTGGFTAFTYEGHDYGSVAENVLTQNVVFGVEQTASVHTVEGGIDDIVSFSVAGSAEGLMEIDATFTPNENDDACIDCPYGLIEVVNTVTGEQVYRASTNREDHTFRITSGTYELLARVPTAVGAEVSATLTWREATTIDLTTLPVARVQAGGVRVRRIRQHDGLDAANDIVREYAYTTQIDGDTYSSGALVNAPSYTYRFLYNGACSSWYYARSILSQTPLGMTQGSQVGYREVKVTHHGGHDGYSVHQFYSPYHFPDEYIPGDTWPHGNRTSYDYKRGQPLRTDHYNADGVVQQTVVYTYAYRSEAQQAFRAFSYKGDFGYHNDGIHILTPPLFHRFEVISQWMHPATKTVTVYDEAGQDGVTSTETYTYAEADHLQPTHVTATNGAGTARVTALEYAHEHHQPGMAEANMLSQVYRQSVQTAGGAVQARTWATWRLDLGEYWRPDEAWVWAGNGTPPPQHGGTGTQRIASYVTYDDYGHVIHQRDALERDRYRFYGDNDHNLSNDPLHDGLAHAFLTGMAQGDLAVEYDYQPALGQVRSITDENGHAVSFAYDPLGRLTTTRNTAGAPVSEIAYHLSTGDVVNDPSYVQATTHLDATTAVVSTEFFDGLGRPFLTQLAEGNGPHILSTTRYDAMGRAAEVWKPYRDEDGNGRYDFAEARLDYQDQDPFAETRYLPDLLARIDEVIPEGGAVSIRNSYGVASLPEGPHAYVETTDEDGQVVRVYTDAFGHRVRSEAGIAGGAAEAVTTMTYDVRGNLLAVYPPNYHCTYEAQHPERCPSPTDPNWITRYTYDPRGQLIAASTPDADGTGGEDFRYAYDAHRNLRAVEDPARSGSGYLYTDYDEFDRVVETGLCSGAAFPSPPGATSCSGGTKSEAVVYTYDTATPAPPVPGTGLGTLSNPKGHLVQVAFGGGYYQYAYDDEGRVADLYVYLDGLGNGKQLTYAYDRQGTPTSVHVQPAQPGEAVLFTYAYDAAGRLRDVRSQTGTEAAPTTEAVYTYTPTGQVQQLHLGAVQTVDYTYHLRDWLTQINDPDHLGGDAFALLLGYDANVAGGTPVYRNGTISSLAWAGLDQNGHLRDKVGYSFSYDPLNRLTAADFNDYGVGLSYDVPSVAYDPNGNITHLSRDDPDAGPVTIGYAYAAGRNRLSDVTGIACVSDPSPCFAYDANGNMTRSRVADPVAYDRRNQPTTMTMGSDALTFRYDADGRRIYKKLDDGTGQVETFYLRGLDGSVLAVYQNTGAGAQLQYWNILSGGAVIGRIKPAGGSP